MSRVLVTGATGFVGNPTVTALLRRGADVHAVARTAGAPRTGLTWHETDLLASRAADELCRAVKASHLLHLAWYAEPGRFWNATENETWRDVTADLVEAFAAAGGRRALLAGSCAEYRWEDQPLRESDSRLEPATLYGECKLAAYRACSAIAQEHGLRLAWGRLFFLYGPGEARGRLVSDVTVQLLGGQRVATTPGTQRRDFLHVRDAGEALVAILESSVEGAVNVCSGVAPTVRSIVEQIAEAAGGAGQVDFGALPIRHGDPRLIVGDSSRLRDEVGYSPATSLRNGLSETVAWWRRELAQATRRQRSTPG